ncbi:MAG: Tat pathway signal protein [Paenarthrobacter ureafaciens]|uniref:Tat pathway signal protein n=1 Tax=Paenarthrobacter ureafaciens TaxID=37931 RepID=UPI001AD05D41|nr:Tat pathway signal protein [Paenarthrobacter ureafaciens]MBN9130023.1 Tat pathway signal protein [Paenarthrobacter ureafaciens]
MDPQDSPDGTGPNAGDGRGNGDPGTGRNQPKPPPWQVPKPELHPGLAQPPQDTTGQGQPRQGKSPQGKPGQGKPNQGKPGQGQNQDAPGGFLPVVNPFEKEREREAHREAARKKRSQRRTVVVGLGVTALLAGTITAIVASNEAEADYAQVCFNEETGERVNDDQCNNSSSAGRSSGVYAWYFYSRGASVPAVGQNRSSYPSYTKTAPQGAKTSKGYSTKGGTVSRGGFGSSSKSGSSGG